MAAVKPIPTLKKSVPAAAMTSFVESSPTESESPASHVADAVDGSKPRADRLSKSKPEPSDTVKVTYRFTHALDRRLALYAVNNRVSRTDVVVEAVEAFLKKNDR